MSITPGQQLVSTVIASVEWISVEPPGKLEINKKHPTENEFVLLIQSKGVIHSHMCL